MQAGRTCICIWFIRLWSRLIWRHERRSVKRERKRKKKDDSCISHIKITSHSVYLYRVHLTLTSTRLTHQPRCHGDWPTWIRNASAQCRTYWSARSIIIDDMHGRYIYIYIYTMHATYRRQYVYIYMIHGIDDHVTACRIYIRRPVIRYSTRCI